jgi:hypothetical protein
VKKSTPKKPKIKSVAKPKTAAKKSSISLKNKKTNPKLHTSSAPLARKGVAVSLPKKGSRKPALTATSARPIPTPIQQKAISQNGKLVVEKERKPEKAPELTAPAVKRPSPPPEPIPPVKTYLSARATCRQGSSRSSRLFFWPSGPSSPATSKI